MKIDKVIPLMEEVLSVMNGGKLEVSRARELREKMSELLSEDDMPSKIREQLIVANNCMKSLLESVDSGEGWSGDNLNGPY